jgi:hypothetical protein
MNTNANAAAFAASTFAAELLSKLVHSGALSRPDAIWLCENTAQATPDAFPHDDTAVRIGRYFGIAADLLREGN